MSNVPDQLWCPPSLLLDEYLDCFSRVKGDRSVRVAAVIDLVTRLRMVGARHLLPPGAFMACLVTSK